jgi:hypothetical protein
VALPHFERIRRALQARGVEFIAMARLVSTGGEPDSSKHEGLLREERSQLRRMVEYHGMTMPIGIAAPTSAYLRDYEPRTDMIFIIDKRGTVVVQKDEMEHRDLVRTLAELGYAKNPAVKRP